MKKSLQKQAVILNNENYIKRYSMNVEKDFLVSMLEEHLIFSLKSLNLVEKFKFQTYFRVVP
jgi:hypothetical protein